MCILEEGDALCPQAPHAILLIPHPTSSPYIIIPNGIPHNTIPLTATQPHTILTHTTPQHHPPYTIPHTPRPSCPWPHTIGPQQTRCRCPLWDMLSLPGVLWIPCSHQKTGCSIEHTGVAGRREGTEYPTEWVQVGGAKDPLCPASAHSPSWKVTHPAQDNSP